MTKFLHLKKRLAGKKFDDDDEVQEEVMTWFKGQTSMTRGYRCWFQVLTNVWTMLATMLKNKDMYRQFIHSVVFVNLKCSTCLRLLYLYFPDTPRIFKVQIEGSRTVRKVGDYTPNNTAAHPEYSNVYFEYSTKQLPIFGRIIFK